MHFCSPIIALVGLAYVSGEALAALSSNIHAPSTDQASRELQRVLLPACKHPSTFDSYAARSLQPASHGYTTTTIDLIKQYKFAGIHSLKRVLELAKAKVDELDLRQYVEDVTLWVEHNPWQAILWSLSTLGLVAPGLFSGSALKAVGFGVGGVRCASIASIIQSIIGPVAKKSTFAALQKAGTAGYRLANANRYVRAPIALTNAAVAQRSLLKEYKALISDSGKRLVVNPVSINAKAAVSRSSEALKSMFGQT